ncbi:MAG: DUF998 domain-containing protein [Promethearchaeota archaeon]|jgi:hypothetical protein
MLSEKKFTESTVSLQELFPSYAKQFLKPFENIVEPEFHKDMHLPFKIADRKHTHKISPILRLARPEDAHEIVEIYKELYEETYPYKEMEDEQEICRMIKDPSIQWIVYQDPSFHIAGCITFVLDFDNSRGYIRGFMLRKKYQGHVDITKAMIGSMLGMLHKYKDIILTWYVENRTFHSKSQYSMWVCGIAPIGFYPNKDVFLGEVESDLMQVLYDERVLREFRSPDIPRFLSSVESCYQFSEKRYHLGSYMVTTPEIDLDHIEIRKLKTHLVKQVSKDKFGYETIIFTLEGSDSFFEFLYTPQVQNFEKTHYNVKNIEELSVFIQEFIDCGKELGIRYCEAFISAYRPEHQQLFYDAGLKPRGYVPSWKFNARTDLFEDHVLFNKFEGSINRNIQLIDEGEDLLQVLELYPSTFKEELKSIPKEPKRKPLITNSQVVQKCVKSSCGIGVVGYLTMIILSVLIATFSGPKEYNLLKHTISDLGSLLFTPLPVVFDSACMMAGLVAIPYYVFFRKKVSSVRVSSKKNVLLKSGTSAGIVGGVGYFFVGVFSLERGGPDNVAHGLSSGIAFAGFVSAITLFSIQIVFFQSRIPKSFGMFGLSVPLLLFGLYCLFATPLIEWCLLFSILGFSAPMSLWSFFR